MSYDDEPILARISALTSSSPVATSSPSPRRPAPRPSPKTPKSGAWQSAYVELDEQNELELNKQTDVELDIDGIRTQLNNLPCIPGGECSCNTDFTSQIPEYILDLFNMMPENNIIIVDNDKIVYL